METFRRNHTIDLADALAFLLIIAFLPCVCSEAADGIPDALASFVATPSTTIDVWSELPPGGVPENFAEEEWNDVQDGLHSIFVRNVSIPTLAFYPAKESNGACVLVFPGGGYTTLAYNYEGTDIARWFNEHGISAAVLKYRVPQRDGVPRHWAAFQDAQRAIRLVRAHADEWKIDPNRVGVLGFSAGGHLAISVANDFATQSYEPIDEIDKIDVRPNFAVPVYPGLLAEKTEEVNVNTELKLSEQIHINPNAPPHFIACAADDLNRGLASAVFFCELKKQGVPCELHVPMSGGHGFGIREGRGYATEWIENCEKWLRAIQMIP